MTAACVSGINFLEWDKNKVSQLLTYLTEAKWSKVRFSSGFRTSYSRMEKMKHLIIYRMM